MQSTEFLCSYQPSPSFSLPVLSLWLWLEVLTVRLQVGVYVLCTCACKCVTSTLPGLLPKWYQSARRKSNSAELYCVSNIATHDCFVCQFKLPVSDIACKINTTLSFLTCFGWEEWRFWFWITPACLYLGVFWHVISSCAVWPRGPVSCRL